MSESHKASGTHLEPISKTTLTQVVFEKLVTSILQGPWKEGDRIPSERELCQQLGIGRASLREALKALELVGMLDSRVGDGTFVCPRSEFLSRPLLWAITSSDRSELRDIIEARRLLEEAIAAFAAERATAEEVREIAQTIEDFRANLTIPNAALDADLRFHIAVAGAAHNEVLNNSVQLLRNLMKQWLLLKLQVPQAAQKVLQQHEAIYSAIRYRDAARARSLMSEHLAHSARLVIEIADSR